MADNNVFNEFNKPEIIDKFYDNLSKFNDNLDKLNENFNNIFKSNQDLNQNLYLNLKDQIEKLQERVKILEVKDQIEILQQKVQILEQQNEIVQNKENHKDIVNSFDPLNDYNFNNSLINDSFKDIEKLSENLLNESK